MKFKLLVFITIFISNIQAQKSSDLFISSDIANFWNAFDKIKSTEDTVLQYKYLNELFLDKGTEGLKAIMEARQYTAESYLEAIKKYPEFWNSIRKNTFKTPEFISELKADIVKLKAIYPDLKPANLYFTIGALRTNGTTRDGRILIGSELAMTDRNTVSSEFEEPFASARRAFFDSEPINDLVLLNVHEYVHIQQKPMVYNLLSQCLYEGIAEFVSVTATGKKSAAPAIDFGYKNEKAVRDQFEHDMFRGNKLQYWLWSDAKNKFNVRDLGYFIGYVIAERYYSKAKNKKEAIAYLIEMDYENETEVEKLIDGTGFFSASVKNLFNEFDKKRPTVISVEPFTYKTTEIDPKTNLITIHFSQPMNKEFRGFDYGPLGENNVLSVRRFAGFSEDGMSVTIETELSPDKQFQVLITNNFQSEDGYPLKAHLIDIRTAKD